MSAWITRGAVISAIMIFGGICFGEGQDQSAKFEFSYLLKQAPAHISVRGSSTIGGWECSQSRIDGQISINISAKALRKSLAVLLEGEPGGAILDEMWKPVESRVQVAVDANGFNCDNKRMKRDLVNAIQADKYPYIKFWFTKLIGEVVVLDDREGSYLGLKIGGDLLFGGERRKTVHTAEMRLIGDGLIEVKGLLDLEMTHFNVKPPDALFGLIRAEDNFQVEYRIKIDANEQKAHSKDL